jgi:excisionase family DNA binding protein
VTAPHLLTEAEAAARLGISPRTLRKIRTDGEIRYVRPSPRKVYYTEGDCAEYLARQTRQETQPCPSINPPKARASTSISSGKGKGIMARLAARPGGMPNGLKLISGGKSH